MQCRAGIDGSGHRRRVGGPPKCVVVRIVLSRLAALIVKPASRGITCDSGLIIFCASLLKQLATACLLTSRQPISQARASIIIAPDRASCAPINSFARASHISEMDLSHVRVSWQTHQQSFAQGPLGQLVYRVGWNNLINKFFEARVTAQRVEHRIDLDVRNAAGFTGAIALF